MRSFYVFDLDGTLADLSHRRHLVTGENPDHPKFFASVGGDLAIKPVIDILVTLHAAGHKIEIWSGRSDECRDETERWLRRHGIPKVPLIMRNAGDKRPDEQVKLDFLRGTDWPDVIFDDRDRVVAAWRARGIVCFQVAPGSF